MSDASFRVHSVPSLLALWTHGRTPLLIDTRCVLQANGWAGQRHRPDYLDQCGFVINACTDVVGPGESITCPDLLVLERRAHTLAVGAHQVLSLSRLSAENGLSVLAN